MINLNKNTMNIFDYDYTKIQWVSSLIPHYYYLNFIICGHMTYISYDKKILKQIKSDSDDLSFAFVFLLQKWTRSAAR